MSFEALTNNIPTGERNAIHQAELADKLHTSRAQLKQDIRQARLAGVPIMSGAAGYWIADNEGDKERFSRSMRKQAFGRLRSISGINAPAGERDSRMELLERIEAAENGES